jgi:hypothetical protein
MNPYIHSLKEITAYLESLPIDPHKNALWDVLHQARWHFNIDWVRWVEENKSLIEIIILYSYINEIPGTTYMKLNESMPAKS